MQNFWLLHRRHIHSGDRLRAEKGPPCAAEARGEAGRFGCGSGEQDPPFV